MKYRKKPVVIEAVQITDEWFDKDHPNDLHPRNRRIVYDPVNRRVQVETLEGVMVGKIGDWLITGVQGEVYPCRADIFAMTYEPASPSPAAPKAVCPGCSGSGEVFDELGLSMLDCPACMSTIELAKKQGMIIARVLKSFTLMAKNEPHEDMIGICADIQKLDLSTGECPFCSHPHDHYHGCRMEEK